MLIQLNAMLFYWKASNAMSSISIQSCATREEGNRKDFNVYSTEFNVIIIEKYGNNGIDYH
jgi:hypothetical protein